MNECEFKIGDLVRLKTGKSPKRVLSIKKEYAHFGYMLKTVYLGPEAYFSKFGNSLNGVTQKWRRAEDFVRYEQETPEQETEMVNLYQLKSDPNRFGIALLNGAGKPIRNSNSQVILEMKGEGGKVEAFNVEDIELVTPFTIKLHRLTIGGTTTDSQKDVIGEPGQVQKNDVLLELDCGVLWRVTAIDTKCRSADENRSKWIKIMTENLKFGANE